MCKKLPEEILVILLKFHVHSISRFHDGKLGTSIPPVMIWIKVSHEYELNDK